MNYKNHSCWVMLYILQNLCTRIVVLCHEVITYKHIRIGYAGFCYKCES
jgi:hypothetical protein